MSLSDKAIKEFQEIYKKKYGKDISPEEARDAGERLVGLFEVLFDSHVAELRLKEKLKDHPKGFSLMDDEIYNCGICHTQIRDEELWYDKWGKKCLACQDAVNKKIIPGKICYNNKDWYAVWELDSCFKLKAAAARKLIRQGVLKARIVPKSGFEVILLKENTDVLPPKEILKYVSVPVEGKEGAFSMTPWYEIYDPKKVLGSYKIWPYLTAFNQK
ncbi:MAG: hypothetical protein PHG66_03380 [Candidatus Colwellbacteria bacterium]|nr:hypothetical protein [Candidatus Colwellbacteria bacterium]